MRLEAPPPALGQLLKGCAAGDGVCVQGIRLGLRDPILCLSHHDGVTEGLRGLDVDVWHLLQVLAALAAAAACGAAEQTAGTAADAAAAAARVCAAKGDQGDHAVPGLQRAHAQGQEVPGLELTGQDAWAAGLQELEQHHQKDHENDGHPHAHEHWPPSQREAKHCQWDQAEEDDQVEDGKPAVLS